MSQVIDPVLLDSTGQNIFAGILAVVSAIQSRGMPSPSASNPQMDGAASPGTSNDYARGDHVHPVDTSRASASAVASLNNRYTDNTLWISNSDANDYKTSGMYAMATGNANIPAAWGILFVIAPRNDTIEQEYRCSGNIWSREFRSNTWSAWTQAVKQSQLAYVETGTTASQNYTAGQYISWNGILYTANQAISSGTTLSAGTGGNLTECVGGGLNSLSNVANANVTFSNNVTGYTYQNEYHLSKSGNIVATHIYMSTSSIAGMGTLLCTVPAAFRPSVNRRIATWLTYNGESKVETVFLSPTGEITTASGGSNVSGFIRVFGTYML